MYRDPVMILGTLTTSRLHYCLSDSRALGLVPILPSYDRDTRHVSCVIRDRKRNYLTRDIICFDMLQTLIDIAKTKPIRTYELVTMFNATPPTSRGLDLREQSTI